MQTSRSSDPTLQRAADRINNFLANFSLFSGLDGGVVERLARSATVVRLPRGTVVFRQGQPCTGLHLVIEGQIKLALQTAHGHEKVIELFGPRASFGEAALFLDEPHLMTAEAITESRIVQLDKESVLAEIRRNPEFSRRVLNEMCRRLNQRTRDLESCITLSGSQRVTAYLLNRLPAGANGTPVAVTLPTTKSIIASRLNLTQEHFSRILHEMQSAGLVIVRGRQIQLLDVDRLRGFPS